MASEEKTTPVVLCGKREEIARRVIESLKPEFEGELSRTYGRPSSLSLLLPRLLVVRYVCTPDACVAEIPTILNGHTPASPSSILGSGNHSDRPVAIIIGGGYSEDFDMVFDSVERTFAHTGSGVAWLRTDMGGPEPDTMENSYAIAAAQRMKVLLTKLRDEGKLGSGVHWY